MKKVLAGFILAVACLPGVLPAHAGPREECMAAGATMPCLDARLKEAA